MNKIKGKINNIGKNIVNSCKKIVIEIATNPKKVFITLINRIREMIKNNVLFFAFVLLSLFCSTLVRYLSFRRN